MAITRNCYSIGRAKTSPTYISGQVRSPLYIHVALIQPNHWAASVAQWLEHLPSKQCVVDSNPTRAAL